MKSTLSRREREQRAEWVVSEIEAIRKDGSKSNARALLEMKQLVAELEGLRK
jgi:hypothetical protein